MPATIRPLLAAGLLTAALVACDDPYAVEPQLEVVADSFVVFGINDAPVGGASAISLVGAPTRQQAVPATASLNFDIAVDVNADGSVRLITPRALINVLPDPRTLPHRVGLQVVSSSYETLLLAPGRGYTFDSLLTVTPGQTVAVQSANTVACPVPYLGTMLYAKLVVDSVRMNPARVFFRSTVDPNCDFRSLVPGIPKD